MSEDAFLYVIDCMVKICKWFALQALLFILMPYVWNYEYSASTLMLILLYTTLYAVYWNFVPIDRRIRLFYLPYMVYGIIAVIVYCVIGEWCSSLWKMILLPFYGVGCFIGVKLFKKFLRKLRKRFRFGRLMAYMLLVLFFVLLKVMSVAWMRTDAKNDEYADVMERRDYLVGKLITSPQRVIDQMPSIVGAQFQGEWALYSCSMLSASLVNISHIHPESKTEHLGYVDQLIRIVMSPELRHYDAMRWGEDPLETLDSNNSHVSYLSHLAWMICNYKALGGDDRYDELLGRLCAAMNRRILASEVLNIPTYPGELIYVPDMLVAIVALKQYADMYGGKYRSTVQRWVRMAQCNWHDAETEVLVSMLHDNGSQVDGMPVKGSYAALNCYYLSLIDKGYALEQYTRVKLLYWRGGLLPGLKEYRDRPLYIGPDIDSGIIFFGLSPSGTAFFAGPATYFGDTDVSNDVLATAEIAGHTIKFGHERHYFLANVALVGEAIMLAMRTNHKP